MNINIALVIIAVLILVSTILLAIITDKNSENNLDENKSPTIEERIEKLEDDQIYTEYLTRNAVQSNDIIIGYNTKNQYKLKDIVRMIINEMGMEIVTVQGTNSYNKLQKKTEYNPTDLHAGEINDPKDADNIADGESSDVSPDPTKVWKYESMEN